MQTAIDLARKGVAGVARCAKAGVDLSAHIFRETMTDNQL